MQHTLGYFLILAVFAGITYIPVTVMGWRETLKVYALAAIATTMVVTGVFLIN